MNLTDKLRYDFITRQIMASVTLGLILAATGLFGAVPVPETGDT